MVKHYKITLCKKEIGIRYNGENFSLPTRLKGLNNETEEMRSHI